MSRSHLAVFQTKMCMHFLFPSVFSRPNNVVLTAQMLHFV